MNYQNQSILSTQDLYNMGKSKYLISKMIKNEQLSRIAYGKYIFNTTEQSDYLQYLGACSKAVFSYSTALYLLGYSDRIPSRYDITVPYGYNQRPIMKLENYQLHFAKEEMYQQGVISVDDSFGNQVSCYEIEKVLVEILKHPEKCDKDIFINALKQYLKTTTNNIYKLMKYSKAYKVDGKLRTYMEVLL